MGGVAGADLESLVRRSRQFSDQAAKGSKMHYALIHANGSCEVKHEQACLSLHSLLQEEQTKPEGQVHFFPIIFNGKQLYEVMKERCGPSQNSA